MIDISRASKQEKDDALKESKACRAKLLMMGSRACMCFLSGAGVFEASVHRPVQRELQRGTDSIILLDDTKHRERTAGCASSWTTVKEVISREE